MHETTRTGATLRDLLDEAEELARREQSNVALNAGISLTASRCRYGRGSVLIVRPVTTET